MKNEGFSLITSVRKVQFGSLCLLFLITPILYSGLYLPGVPGNLAEWIFRMYPGFLINGFERVKVGFFFVPIILALIAQLFLVFRSQTSYDKKQWHFIFWISLVWTGTCSFLNYDINPYFWSGSPINHHGWFFFVGLLGLFWILESTSQKEKNIYLRMSLCAFGMVFIYAFFQKIGVDPLSGEYESRLDPSRIFSVLGNPNYVAGYALIFLPLFHTWSRRNNSGDRRKNIRRLFILFFWSLCGLLVFWSKSYLGEALFALYFLYSLIQEFVENRKCRQYLQIVIFGTLFIVAVFFLYLHWNEVIGLQKVQGFIARWYLWQTGIAAILASPSQFLFGYGPDGTFAVSQAFRHPLLSVYEDPGFMIDSSHNVIIDMFVYFGFLITLGILFFLFRGWFRYASFQQESLLLFFLYFSFNIPVLVHFLIMLLILSIDGKRGGN